MIYEVPNAEGQLRVGASVRAHLATAPAIEAVAVPEAAVVRERGVDHVFVQVEGENFERRTVRVGLRDRGWAQIIDGVQPEERVVVDGAYTVKLASGATSTPAHGHPH